MASCANGIDGSLITTICTFPVAANNHGPIASAPCTVGPPVYDVDQVATTCTMSDTTVFVATSACPASTAQSGTGPEIICSTTTTLGAPNATCAVGVAPVSPFDTTTNCYPVVTSPMADYAGTCVPGATATPGESVTCNLRQIDNLVSDAGCADSDVGGIKTSCTTASGPGYLYKVTQTKTVTTTPFSGATPSGPDAVNTSTIGPNNVDGVCYPTPQTFTAQPAVDIAGCSAWPCTEVTVLPGGSENSLADVAQYYYKTDLRPLMTNDPKNGGDPRPAPRSKTTRRRIST